MARSKATTGIYVYGNQNSLNDIFTAIANLDMFLSWIIKSDDQQGTSTPDIIRDLRDLFVLYSDTTTKKWFDRWVTSMPWIGHYLLLQIQSLIQYCMGFGTDHNIITMVQQGEDVPTSGLLMYDMCVDHAKKTIMGLTFDGGTIGNYSTEPVTYKCFQENDTNKRPKQMTNDQTGNQLHQQQHGQRATDNRYQERTTSRDRRNSTRSSASHPEYGFLCMNGCIAARFPCPFR